MTITTAKLSLAVRQAWTRPLALPLALSALLAAASAQAIDLDIDLDQVKKTVDGLDYTKPSANAWRIVPIFDLRQIYTDNVSLQPSATAHGQFLTEFAPGALVTHQSRRLKVDGMLQWRLYANTNDKYATRRSSNQLRGSARGELVDDMVFVDASANFFQQSISPFGPLVSDNDYASTNRADVKTWQISPYVLNRYGRVATSELRYRHDSVDAGSSGLNSTVGDTLSLRVNSGTAWDDLGWGISASQQHINDKRSNDSTIKTASVNLSYQLLDTFSLTAAAVHDDYDYEAIGGANGGSGWSAGFRWTPSRRTFVDASWGQRYYGPSRALKALHRTRRTAWDISYDDAVVTSRSKFLLPTGVVIPGELPGDPTSADLGSGLFRPDIIVPMPGNPTGVPVGPGNNINFFSNRYSLQKQARAGVALRGARSSAVLGVFKLRREALSVRAVDEDLLGSPVDAVNDNISQAGLNVMLTYNITPRSIVSLKADAADNKSLTTGFKARSNAIRLTLRHQLGRNIAASGELRRVSGATGLTSGPRYTENALSVSLNMQL